MTEKALFFLKFFLDKVNDVRVENCRIFAGCGSYVIKFSNAEDFDVTTKHIPFLKRINYYESPARFQVIKEKITLDHFECLAYTASFCYLVTEPFLMKIITGAGSHETFEGRMCLAFGTSHKYDQFLGFRIFRNSVFEEFMEKNASFPATGYKVEYVNGGNFTKGVRV